MPVSPRRSLRRAARADDSRDAPIARCRQSSRTASGTSAASPEARRPAAERSAPSPLGPSRAPPECLRTPRTAPYRLRLRGARPAAAPAPRPPAPSRTSAPPSCSACGPGLSPALPSVSPLTLSLLLHGDTAVHGSSSSPHLDKSLHSIFRHTNKKTRSASLRFQLLPSPLFPKIKKERALRSTMCADRGRKRDGLQESWRKRASDRTPEGFPPAPLGRTRSPSSPPRSSRPSVRRTPLSRQRTGLQDTAAGRSSSQLLQLQRFLPQPTVFPPLLSHTPGLLSAPSLLFLLHLLF